MSSAIHFVTENQCSYCREEGSCRVDPRKLPCGHVSCLPCLAADLSRTKIVTCPLCKKKVMTSVASLPEVDCAQTKASDAEGSIREVESDDCTAHNDKESCSSCVSSATNQVNPATHYCKQCSRLYCGDHLQLHSELLHDHEVITIEEYSTVKSELLCCEQHTKYLIIVGCSVCLRVYCNMCLLVTPNYCFKATGSSNTHQYCAIDDLVSIIKSSLNEGVSNLVFKKGGLESVVEEAERVAEAVQAYGERCLRECEEARDKQIVKINRKYDEIRTAISDSTSEIKQAVDLLLTNNREKCQAIQDAMTSLEECLSRYSHQEIIRAQSGLLEESNQLITEASAQLPELSIVTLSPTDTASRITIRTGSSPIDAVLTNVDITRLRISEEPDYTEPSAPPLYTESLAALAPASTRPFSLTLVKTVPLYKSAVRSPPKEIFCSSNGMLYSLCNSHLNRFSDAFSSPRKNVSISDDNGTFILANNSRLYTRQHAGPSLVNVYPLQVGLILPKQPTNFIRWEDRMLIESFAVADDLVIFCEDKEVPRLVIFSMTAQVATPKLLAVEVGGGGCIPIFIAGINSEYVAMITRETTDARVKVDMLRLVKLADGKSIWRIPLEKLCDTYITPYPITYHNGYIYLHIFTGSIKCVEVWTGNVVSTLRLPVIFPVNQTTTVETISLCVFSENSLVFPTKQKYYPKSSRSNPDRTVETGVVLTFWEIDTRPVQ